MTDKQRQCTSSCCGGSREALTEIILPARAVRPLNENIPVVETRLTLADRLGGWAVRWGFGRNRYSIAPGLYAVRDPEAKSVVLVTANYRLSFDALRKELGGLDAWILVLDTKGINVWCAAGKGTFGTDELVRRIEISGLPGIVSHRTIIVPQLGATGVAAFKVKQESGFNVVFGPIRARDIKTFLLNGMKATGGMRSVTFTLPERLAVIPVELVSSMKILLLAFAALALVNLFIGKIPLSSLLPEGLPFLGAVLTGTVAVPALLPWIPFRSFALKGWLLGILWALGISLIRDVGAARFVGYLLILPALSSYLALNFTGSTTFTSQSGVNREIRLFARPMAVSGILGILVLAGRLIA